MPYNFFSDSFHTKKLCRRLSSFPVCVIAASATSAASAHGPGIGRVFRDSDKLYMISNKSLVLRQISYRRCVLYGRCRRCSNPGQNRIFLAGSQWLSLICEQVDDSAARVKQTLSDRRHGVAPVLLRVTFCRSSYEDGKRQAEQWNKQQLYWKPDR